MSFNALQAKTWRFNSIGDTDVLTLETLPVALPAAGEVLIQMKTIGLNRADVMFGVVLIFKRQYSLLVWDMREQA